MVRASLEAEDDAVFNAMMAGDAAVLKAGRARMLSAIRESISADNSKETMLAWTKQAALCVLPSPAAHRSVMQHPENHHLRPTDSGWGVRIAATSPWRDMPRIASQCPPFTLTAEDMFTFAAQAVVQFVGDDRNRYAITPEDVLPVLACATIMHANQNMQRLSELMVQTLARSGPDVAFMMFENVTFRDHSLKMLTRADYHPDVQQTRLASLVRGGVHRAGFARAQELRACWNQLREPSSGFWPAMYQCRLGAATACASVARLVAYAMFEDELAPNEQRLLQCVQNDEFMHIMRALVQETQPSGVREDAAIALRRLVQVRRCSVHAPLFLCADDAFWYNLAGCSIEGGDAIRVLCTMQCCERHVAGVRAQSVRVRLFWKQGLVDGTAGALRLAQLAL